MIILVFVAVVVLLLIGIRFYVQKGKIAREIVDVIPAGAMFYLQVNDLEMNIRDFQKTALASELQAIDFPGAMQALGAGDREMLFYQVLKEEVLSEEQMNLFLKIFGHQAAIAYYWPESTAESFDFANIMKSLSGLCIMTRLGPEAQFIELLMTALSKGSEDVTQTSEEYRGETIYRVDVRGIPFPISYVRFDDVLVVGIGSTAAQRAIDVVYHDDPALSGDPVFLAMKQSAINNAQQIGFLRYEQFVEKMNDVVMQLAGSQEESARQAMQQQMAKGFEGLQGFQSIALSSRYGQPWQSRLEMLYDRSQLSAEVAKIFTLPKVENRSLAFIPKESVLYSWNSLFGLKQYLEHIAQLVAQHQEKSEGDFFNGMVFSFEDMQSLVSLLTYETGWYFLGIDLTDMAPIPQAGIILGVNDTDKAQALIRQWVERVGIVKFDSENYRGHSLEVGTIPLVAKLEPTYCVLNGYLVLATNRQVIYRAIDASLEPNKALSDHDFWRGTQPGMPEFANAVFFADFRALSQALSRLVAWGNTWADVQYSRQQAFQAGAVKRMEEIDHELAQTQQEIQDGEQRLATNRTEMDLLANARADAVETNKEIERKTRLLDSARRSVLAAEQEEQTLLAIKNDPLQTMTEQGVALLAEVQADLQKKKEREAVILNDIAALEERSAQLRLRVQTYLDLVAKIAEDEKFLEEARPRIVALEESRVEVKEMIQGYQNADTPTAAQREALLNDIVNPLLTAVSNIEWLAVNSWLRDDRLRSDAFMQVK